MNRVVIGVFLLFLGLGFAFAANNYFKSGNNWDANVPGSEPANDVFMLTGNLVLEGSGTPAYLGGYRGSITGTISSDLFGDFSIPVDLDLDFRSNTSIPTECGTSTEVYDIGAGQFILSPSWGELFIQSGSYFCSNNTIYLNLWSDSLGYKDIGNAGNQNLIVNEFGEQQIYVSGVMQGETGTGLLEDGGIENIENFNIGNAQKTLLKAELKKNVNTIFRTYLSSPTGNKAIALPDLNGDFLNTSSDDIYYLYDYEGEPLENITFSAGVYENKGKILTVGNNPRGKIAVTGKNTVVLKGGNIYINTNIYNTDDTSSLLLIVAKRGENGHGGNIYIDPDVTNIDAMLIADGSLISVDTGTIQEVSDTNQSNNLKNQLLIYGSIMTSNTIGTDEIPYGADYYQKGIYTSTNKMNQSIYDLVNLRTFSLAYGSGASLTPCIDEFKAVPIDGNGDYKLNAWAGQKECYIDDPTEGDANIHDLRESIRVNPLIIEYNPNIIKISPYILSNH